MCETAYEIIIWNRLKIVRASCSTAESKGMDVCQWTHNDWDNVYIPSPTSNLPGFLTSPNLQSQLNKTCIWLIWNALEMRSCWINTPRSSVLSSKWLFFPSSLHFKRLLIILWESMHVLISRQFLRNYIRWGSMQNDRWVILVIREMERIISPMILTPKKQKTKQNKQQSASSGPH